MADLTTSKVVDCVFESRDRDQHQILRYKMSQLHRNNNQKRAEILGMPWGTANNRLRKSILFRLVGLCNLDICFRCNEKIELEDDLSIEHTTAWLNSEDPISTFFDVGKIAFSHLSCNIALGNRQPRIYSTPKDKHRAAYLKLKSGPRYAKHLASKRRS